MITKEGFKAVMSALARPEPTNAEIMLRQMAVDMEAENTDLRQRLATKEAVTRQLVRVIEMLETDIELLKSQKT